MNDPITIAGKLIPRSDWEVTPASVKAVVTVLSEEQAHIREQLNQTSKNSSRPPSGDGLSKSRPKSEGKGSSENGGTEAKWHRRRGQRSKGKAQGFGFYVPEDCPVHDHLPDTCQHCGEVLSGVDSTPHRHLVVEIPPLPLQVEAHQQHQLTCECCGKATRAALPPDVPASGYGDGLVSLVGLLSSGAHRQSHSMVQSFLSELFNLKLSRRCINQMRTQVSEALSAPVTEALSYVQEQPTIHSDETSFPQRNRDGNNPAGRKGWLWVMCAPLVTVFRVHLSRAQQVAKTLIGEDFSGIVHSDRYSGYRWLAVEQRQVCWAHLKRDFIKIAERQGVSSDIGQALLARQRRLFRWWHRVRDGTMSRDQFIAMVAHLRRGFRAELDSACHLPVGEREKSPLAKSVRTLREILAVEAALWTFVETPGVEPTNNTAERALRSAVIWRRTTQGSQSQKGSEFVGRILTATTSLKAQGRNAWAYLRSAIGAKRLGVEAPSLLPLPQPPDIALPLALPPAQTPITT